MNIKSEDWLQEWIEPIATEWRRQNLDGRIYSELYVTRLPYSLFPWMQNGITLEVCVNLEKYLESKRGFSEAQRTASDNRYASVICYHRFPKPGEWDGANVLKIELHDKSHMREGDDSLLNEILESFTPILDILLATVDAEHATLVNEKIFTQ